jgi:uncharacterized membrane protein YGL010W
MKEIKLLEEYQNSHLNPTNQFLHKICVPLIFFTVVGLFGCLPLPFFLEFDGYELGWHWFFVGGSLIYYASLSMKVFLKMFLPSTLCAAVVSLLLIYLEIRLLTTVYLTVFGLAWVGQFVGHKYEGKKPSFLKDVQFLWIGPLWILNQIL